MSSFTRLDLDDILLSSDKVITSTWTNNTNDLVVLSNYTGSVATESAANQGNFYIDVYNSQSNASGSEVQFSIAYGHKQGSGSAPFNTGVGAVGYSATRGIYNQYRTLVYGDDGNFFNFNGVTPDDILVINVARSRFKQALRPGSLNLKLSGSGGIINLTDNSVTVTGSATLRDVGREFNIVSGSSGTMSGSLISQTDSGSYGKFYPDAGLIILNPRALDVKNIISSPTFNNNGNDKNAFKLFDSIVEGGSFILDSEEKISSRYFFCRVKNQEYNYSSNPTFTDSNGNLTHTSMADNPTVYITTIGLYNDNSDCMAVGKLSQPLKKDFTREQLIRVKLDY